MDRFCRTCKFYEADVVDDSGKSKCLNTRAHYYGIARARTKVCPMWVQWKAMEDKADAPIVETRSLRRQLISLAVKLGNSTTRYTSRAASHVPLDHIRRDIEDKVDALIVEADKVPKLLDKIGNLEAKLRQSDERNLELRKRLEAERAEPRLKDKEQWLAKEERLRQYETLELPGPMGISKTGMSPEEIIDTYQRMADGVDTITAAKIDAERRLAETQEKLDGWVESMVQFRQMICAHTGLIEEDMSGVEDTCRTVVEYIQFLRERIYEANTRLPVSIQSPVSNQVMLERDTSGSADWQKLFDDLKVKLADKNAQIRELMAKVDQLDHADVIDVPRARYKLTNLIEWVENTMARSDTQVMGIEVLSRLRDLNKIVSGNEE